MLRQRQESFSPCCYPDYQGITVQRAHVRKDVFISAHIIHPYSWKVQTQVSEKPSLLPWTSLLLCSFVLVAFKKQLMKVDAATLEVTDGVNLALRNSSVCAQEGGGQEEGDRTLLPSYTRNLKHSYLENALEVIKGFYVSLPDSGSLQQMGHENKLRFPSLESEVDVGECSVVTCR